MLDTSDVDTLKGLWSGKQTEHFKTDEYVVDMKMPHPYCLINPRLNYFPLVADKVNIFNHQCCVCFELICIVQGVYWVPPFFYWVVHGK